LLKTSLLGLVERATCFQIDGEYFLIKPLSVQASLGYYTDFNIRNSSNHIRYDGFRYGGEVRYYFFPKRSKNSPWFMGVSALFNTSQISRLAQTRALNGAFITEQFTPIQYGHERTLLHGIIGNQIRIKRLILDTYMGIGTMRNKVGTIKYEDTYQELLPISDNLFPKLLAFEVPDYENNYTYLDFNFFLKIGYRLF
jgi:Protein of unknown function (DUF3575)